MTDADRRGHGLQAIAAREDELLASRQSAVVACSALKRAYRDILIGTRSNTVLIYLRGSRHLIANRMQARQNHFMPAALLESQLATLEEPGQDEHPIIVDVGGAPDAVIEDVMRQLKARARPTLER